MIDCLYIFPSGYFDYKGAFSNSCTTLNMAENEALQMLYYLGVQHHLKQSSMSNKYIKKNQSWAKEKELGGP